MFQISNNTTPNIYNKNTWNLYSGKKNYLMKNIFLKLFFKTIFLCIFCNIFLKIFLSPPIKMIAISLKDEIETMLKKEGQSNSHWSCAGHQISIFPPQKMAFSAQFCCANPEY